MPTESIIIRRCTLSDIETVQQLQADLLAEGTIYGYEPESHASLVAKLGPFFWVALDSSPQSTGLASGPTKSELIIGYCYGTINGMGEVAVIPHEEPYVEIDELYVAPLYRNQTVGSNLLKQLMDAARAHGIDRFVLYSASQDTEQIMRFYTRHGFRAWAIQMFQ